MLRPVTAAICLAAALPAAAHVVIAQPEAKAGSYHVAAFRIGHGCDGSPTVAVTVTVPPEVLAAKPQPKPGWTVTLTKAPLTVPRTGEGGAVIRDRVATVTWTGRLDPDFFDDFALQLRLPASAGMLAFPTEQKCEKGSIRWTDVAPAGQPWNSVPHPAPVLTITGAPAMGHHH